jgi:hypothetical protein
MSLIDKALEANRNYAKKHDPKLGERPAPKLAVVTCMDPRLSNLHAILGLPHADLDVIRTGGPAVTDDRNHAPQPHRLRIHYIYRRGAERKTRNFNGRSVARSHALLLLQRS